MNSVKTPTLILLASTWGMVGLIWIIQLVHYPLFARIHDDFTSYAKEHVKRISWVVIPLMLIEAICSVWLLGFWNSFDTRTKALFGSSLVILILVWASTFLIQVPCHERLMIERDEQTIQKLVQTNWIRTLGWTARGLLIFAMLIFAE
jgi:hypothetical protein